jgi:hypothetical protein
MLTIKKAGVASRLHPAKTGNTVFFGNDTQNTVFTFFQLMRSLSDVECHLSGPTIEEPRGRLQGIFDRKDFLSYF